MSDQPQPGKFVLPVVLILAAVFSVLIFPPTVALVALLAPSPLLFVYLQRGQVVGLILMGLIFAVLMILAGSGTGVAFCGGIWGHGHDSRRDRQGAVDRWEKCIFLGALGSMVLTTFLMFILFGGESSVVDFFQQQIMKLFRPVDGSPQINGGKTGRPGFHAGSFQRNLQDVCFGLSRFHHGGFPSHGGGQFFSDPIFVGQALRAGPCFGRKIFPNWLYRIFLYGC